MNVPPGYEATCTMTIELVERHKGNRPEFQLPPSQIAFMASLADIGIRIACNAAALDLIADLMRETGRRQLRDFPTAMMLELALEHHGIAIKRVSLGELGIGIGIASA